MLTLDAKEIEKTCVKLHKRIQSKFPNASLLKTCEALVTISKNINHTVSWINKPNYYIRIFSWIIIVVLVYTIVHACILLKVTTTGINIADVVQMIDATFNNIILLGGAGIFLMTFEDRRKRKRVLRSVNELRTIAHIIDSHQLDKDPEYLADSSIEKKLTEHDLGKYLDYCSEMLSLVSKLSFLYVQKFTDSVAQEAVNDLETLTIGLSQKIWQKIRMLKTSD